MTLKQIFSIAALVLFSAAALAYSPQVDSPYLGDTLALMGIIPMLLALWEGRSINNVEFRRALMHQSPTYTKSMHKILPLLTPGIFLLLTLAFFTPMHMHLQFACFVGGIVLVGMGLSGKSVGVWRAKPWARLRLALFAQHRVNQGRDTVSPLPHEQQSRRRHSDILWLAPIILLAFLLRIINLENSLHLWVDEAHFVDGITRLQDDPNTPLFSPMNFIASFTWLYAYLETHSVALFGASLAAPRIISAILGTLTVPALYFLASQMSIRTESRRAARLPLVAALLLAVFPPHVHFSRLALNNIADPLFGTLALAFLLKGARTGQTAPFVLAGIALALTQYFYEGGKLIYPMVAVLYIAFCVISRRLQGRQAARLGFAFLLVVMPLWITLARLDAPYFPRVEAQRLSGPDAPSLLAENGMDELEKYIKGNLAPAWHHLISQEERGGSAAHYGGATGIVMPGLIPFFLAGTMILMWQGHLIPVGVMMLTIFGNSLIMNPDMSARFVVIFPFVVISIATGMAWVMEKIVDSLNTRNDSRVNSTYIINSIFIISVVAMQPLYYFGPHLALFNQQIRPARDHQDVGWRALDFPAGTQVILLTDELTFLPHIEVLEAYFDVDITMHIYHPLHLMLRGNYRLPDDSDLAIFMQPHNRDLRRYLSRSLPMPEAEYSPYNVPQDKQYALYYIPMPR